MADPSQSALEFVKKERQRWEARDFPADIELAYMLDDFGDLARNDALEEAARIGEDKAGKKRLKKNAAEVAHGFMETWDLYSRVDQPPVFLRELINKTMDTLDAFRVRIRALQR